MVTNRFRSISGNHDMGRRVSPDGMTKVSNWPNRRYRRFGGLSGGWRYKMGKGKGLCISTDGCARTLEDWHGSCSDSIAGTERLSSFEPDDLSQLSPFFP